MNWRDYLRRHRVSGKSSPWCVTRTDNHEGGVLKRRFYVRCMGQHATAQYRVRRRGWEEMRAAIIEIPNTPRFDALSRQKPVARPVIRLPDEAEEMIVRALNQQDRELQLNPE